MSLDKTFSSLAANLYKPLLFYIPENVLPTDIKDYVDSSGIPDLYDKVVFIDNTGNGYKLSQKPRLLELLGKSHFLDKNILVLLDCKKQLQPTQFDFLLEKYTKELATYVYITNWMSDNLSVYNKDIDESVVAYFSRQKVVFQEHVQALNRNFSIETLTAQNTNELFEQFKNNMPPIPLFDKKSTKNKPTQLKVEKKKKRVYITDEEADAYLLETVFGIRF